VQLQAQAQTESGTAAFTLQPPAAEFIVGVFALVNALTVVICVLLARYWQALLYNPGGFGDEFRQLRLPPALAITLVVIAVLCLVQGGAWLPWAYLAALPCLVAGISLVHGMVAIKQLKGHWLVVFYTLLVLINPVKELVILAGVIDSWVNFRQRSANGVGGA
jgi:hypothetical protein